MLGAAHSILIWTEDSQRLVPFYRDTLGLTILAEAEGFAVFQLGNLGLRIGTHSEVRGLAQDPYRMMLNFRVEDCQAEYQRLKDRGVEFTRTPANDAFHIVATFLDPDGNVLQLLQDSVIPA